MKAIKNHIPYIYKVFAYLFVCLIFFTVSSTNVFAKTITCEEPTKLYKNAYTKGHITLYEKVDKYSSVAKIPAQGNFEKCNNALDGGFSVAKFEGKIGLLSSSVIGEVGASVNEICEEPTEDITIVGKQAVDNIFVYNKIIKGKNTEPTFIGTIPAGETYKKCANLVNDPGFALVKYTTTSFGGVTYLGYAKIANSTPTTQPTTTSTKTQSQPTYASANTSDYKMPVGYKGPLPECAFDGSCRDVNKIIEVFINFGSFMLGIIGSVALVFFVYGGFMMIISMGNAERVKKGRDILVAAVVGIVIAFSAYALVNFVLDALQVSGDFRIIDNK